MKNLFSSPDSVMHRKSKIIVATFVLVFLLPLFYPTNINAQKKDVPYVPTPESVVEQMLEVADVGPGDYVIDLGSGDGRIIIAAARRGATGYGVDIDPQRIQEANQNARKAGVEDKVSFIEENIFDTDISKASVVTMYLLNSVNKKLRPTLLEELKPGTRVVSHSFNMDEWEADKHLKVDQRNIYYWVIPANIEGKWNWQTGEDDFTVTVNQEFQKIESTLKNGNTTLNVKENILSGDKIKITAVNPSNGDEYEYNGIVSGDKINGTVNIKNGNRSTTENWIARYD